MLYVENRKSTPIFGSAAARPLPPCSTLLGGASPPHARTNSRVIDCRVSASISPRASIAFWQLCLSRQIEKQSEAARVDEGEGDNERLCKQLSILRCASLLCGPGGYTPLFRRCPASGQQRGSFQMRRAERRHRSWARLRANGRADDESPCVCQDSTGPAVPV
jgi:hypothetical protein